MGVRRFRWAVPAGTALALLLAGAAVAAEPAGRGGRLAAIDADQDGMISRAEAEAFLAARAAAVDADGDGRISAEEVAAAHQARRQRLAERHLARLDRDGDGAVSVEEWTQGRLAWFDRLDTNDDGVVDESERQAAHRGRRSSGRQAR